MHDEDLKIATIVGLGAIGSHSARALGRLVERFELHDGDVVEEKNLINQAYTRAHVGLKKADALAALLREEFGVHANARSRFVEGPILLEGIVILCPDSMSVRRKVCHQSLWKNEHVPLVVEARMDAAYAVIHTFDPNVEKHRMMWDHYWYPEPMAVNEGGCSTPDPITRTFAGVVSTLIALQVARFVEQKSLEGMENQIRFTRKTLQIEKHRW